MKLLILDLPEYQVVSENGSFLLNQREKVLRGESSTDNLLLTVEILNDLDTCKILYLEYIVTIS